MAPDAGVAEWGPARFPIARSHHSWPPPRRGTGPVRLLSSAAPSHRSALHRRRDAQSLTLDLSVDVREKARRLRGGGYRRYRLLRGSGPVRVDGETRRPLLAVGGQTLPDIGPAEPQKLQAKGRFEDRCKHPVPMV